MYEVIRDGEEIFGAVGFFTIDEAIANAESFGFENRVLFKRTSDPYPSEGHYGWAILGSRADINELIAEGLAEEIQVH